VCFSTLTLVTMVRSRKRVDTSHTPTALQGILALYREAA